MAYTSFNERWGIDDDATRVRRVYNDFFNAIQELRNPTYQEEDKFYRELGERVPQRDGYVSGYDAPFHLMVLEGEESSRLVFARNLEALLNAVSWTLSDKQSVASVVNDSSDVFGFIILQDEKWQTFPAGHEEYDKLLVIEVIKDLPEKPKSEMVDALGLYKEGKYSLSVGKTRRAIEELLRVTFKNTKGLNSNLSQLKQWLKAKNIDAAIIDYFTSIIGFVDSKYNDLEKHNSVRHDERSAEYFIYQAGVICRYIMRVDKEL